MKQIAGILILLFSFVSSGLTEDFKLGAILSLTGETANFGNACKNGVELARKKLEPELQSQIHVLYEDDELKTKNTISAFNKLVNIDKVDAVLSISSGTSKAIAPLADQKKIPLIAIASDPAVVKDRQYVFNLWVTPDEQAKLLLKEAKKRGYKRVARIVATHDGTLSMKEAFDRANNGQLELVMDEEYPYELKDFRPFITKLKTLKDIDAVFVELFFGQTGLFARQMKDLGVDLPLFNVETFENTNDVKLSEGALVGQWYIQADDPGDVFSKEYKKMFPDAMNYSAGNCHDALLLIAQAVRDKKKGEPLRNFLFAVQDFTGAMGTYSATGDNRFSLPATTKVVTKDGFEKLNS